MAAPRLLSVRRYIARLNTAVALALEPLKLGSVALVALACSSTPSHPGLGGGGDVMVSLGQDAGTIGEYKCEAWAMRECGIELGRSQGQINCARGTQVCESGRWGACMADAAKGTTSVPATPPSLGPSGFGIQAVGGAASTCVDNPCNPYCQVFKDQPDAAVTADRVVTSTTWSSGGSLAGSNVPSAFKDKGSLNAQCSNAAGSDSWNEACQFDQHCVGSACVAFKPTESGSCNGIDITAPTTCIPATGGFRDVTVCNRGTVAAPPGVNCYLYPGGSPQYPNDDPGIGSLVMTTATTIAPGTCETQQLAESLFGQNGIQSLMCNPPVSSVSVQTAGAKYPASSEAVSGSAAWSSPTNAYSNDGTYATAVPANPNGATTGPSFASADTMFGSDGTWSTITNAYADTPAGAYATASPVMPAVASGSVGPNPPTTNASPAKTGEGTWSNGSNAYAADGSYATAALTNPDASTVLTAAPAANNASAQWSNLTRGYASDSLYATSSLTSAGTNTAYYQQFGFNSIPSNAVLDSMTLSVKWKSTVNSTKYSLGAQMVTGATYTAIGSELVKPSPLTTEATNTLTVPAATLAGFTAADLTDSNFKVKLRFTRSNGSVTDATASVDYVQVSLTYHLASTTSSIVFGGFGVNTVPNGATVQMTVQVKWKASAVNSNVTFGLQAYKNWGTANEAAIGAELTRTPALANSDYVDSTAVLAPGSADLSDTGFQVRVRAIRSSGAVNPDVTASIDYVRVSLTWSTGGTPTTHSVLFKRFGFDAVIPQNATITGVTASAVWKLSATTTHSTLGLQAYSGTTALGTEVTNVLAPLVDTTATQTLSSGVTRTDLSDSNFGVRVRVSRDASSLGGNPDFTASLDHVKVTVTWTAPSATHTVAFKNFGFNAIPSNATVTQIKTEARWMVSTSTSHAVLGVQPYIGGGATAVGTESTDTSPPTAATIFTQTLTGLSLSPSDLNDANFAIRVRATRTNGTTGGGNPDFTASLDYVRVTVTYETPVDASVVECNQANNWSATKLVPDPDLCGPMTTTTFQPFTVTRVFQAVCPAGAHPTWKRFGYTTSTPAGTKVEFRFRSFEPTSGSCVALTPVTSGSPTPLATASLTNDPEVCSLAGTGNPCPKDLYTGLGQLPAAAYECLQMDATGTPSTTAGPELIDWTATYDCPPSQ